MLEHLYKVLVCTGDQQAAHLETDHPPLRVHGVIGIEAHFFSLINIHASPTLLLSRPLNLVRSLYIIMMPHLMLLRHRVT